MCSEAKTNGRKETTSSNVDPHRARPTTMHKAQLSCSRHLQTMDSLEKNHSNQQR